MKNFFSKKLFLVLLIQLVQFGCLDSLSVNGLSTDGTYSGPHSDPSKFSFGTVTEKSIALTWKDNATDEVSYELERCSGSQCTNYTSVAAAVLGENSTSFTDTGLTENTAYRYRIRAKCSSGNSNWVYSDSGSTLLNPPTALTTSSLTSSSLTFSWTDQSSSETGYQVQRCTGQSCSTYSDLSQSPLSVNIFSVSETGLSASTYYRYRTRAISGVNNSNWVESQNIQTSPTYVTPATCSTVNTVTVDTGTKGTAASTGRGLWSDIKIIPGTSYPAIAYYDGSSTGGTSTIKYLFWNGSRFIIESVAGDSLVSAGSATSVKLLFQPSGTPFIFWSTGGTMIKGAMRNSSNLVSSTWSTQVLETYAGGATRALDGAVSAESNIGIAYLTHTTNGKVRFIYCPGPCTALSQFQVMNTGGTDFVENTTSVNAMTGIGVGWCKHSTSGVSYPAVAYSGATQTKIRYATCMNATLSNCKTGTNWTGYDVANSTGTLAKLQLDAGTTADSPKILARVNSSQLQVYLGSACNAAQGVFTTSAAIGGLNTGTIWAALMKDIYGRFHVVANESTTSLSYFNSTTTSPTGTWNSAGTIDTLTLPATGGGGAAILSSSNQILTSYGSSSSSLPANLLIGIVRDLTISSSSNSYSYSLPDTTGGINLGTASGQYKNISMAVNSSDLPGVAYVDHSIGSTTGAALKFAIRSGATSSSSWRISTIPGTFSPSQPSLAFDHNSKPWIAYYDLSTFGYYLATNTETDGSGYWNLYQLTAGAKTANATPPAYDSVVLTMQYSSGTAQPLLIYLNSTGTGSPGIRSARFNTSTGMFDNVTLIDSVGGSYAANLAGHFDKQGNIAVAYYDLNTTNVKVSYTTNGTTWATPVQITTPTTGKEGLTLRMNPATGRPALSYYDRANDRAHYAACNSALASCTSPTNWAISTLTSTAGISGLAAASQDQYLGTGLSFSDSGTPYIAHMTGASATLPSLILTNNGTGSFVPLTLVSGTANLTGASSYHFALPAMSVSSAHNSKGQFFSAYVGANNWLYVTSCGD